ncbi:MAG: T9SS type A sorting domain-containing protein [Flavobacteriales bacterium]
MKKIILFSILASFAFGVQAQKFTLSKHFIEDSLFVNDYTDEGVDLVNTTNQKMVIKFRTYINTIDTTNWELLYCAFPACRVYIAYEEICDTMGAKGEEFDKVRISNFSIQPKNTPKDCELCIEFFDMMDSTFRDTLCYKYFASKRALGLASNSVQSNSKIYPNPTQGSVTVENSIGINSIKIVDLSGKEVLNVMDVNSITYSIDLSALKPGTYVLQVENSDDQWTVEKLIIE